MKVPPKRKGNLTIIHAVNLETRPSMKVPPKRKGNVGIGTAQSITFRATLNESPSEKEGKSNAISCAKLHLVYPLNESPSEKEGKWFVHSHLAPEFGSLNESPSEKEGKSRRNPARRQVITPSMKVPPKRKGNEDMF